MESQLEAMMEGWPVQTKPVPPVPKPDFTPQPGVYMVNKSEVNQGNVAMGHLGTMRDNPDFLCPESYERYPGWGRYLFKQDHVQSPFG